MAIYKGNKEIVGLYKGPTEIIKRYKGSNLIYNVFKWLPYSYEHIYNSLVPSVINNKNVKEKAQVKIIYGNSVVENQLCFNGNFSSGATGWSGNSGAADFSTISVSNNVLTQTYASKPDAAYKSGIIQSGDGFYKQTYANHYYLAHCKFKSSIACSVRMYMEGTGYFTSLSVPANQWVDYSFIKQATQDKTKDYVFVNITDAATLNAGDVLEFAEVEVIDLSQRHPFDTPTALTDNRVQALLNRGYVPYNTGTLKNVDIGEISSEPYNLFDEALEIGSIRQDNGQNNDNITGASRSKNYIKVVPGYSYTLEYPTTANLIIYQYDENNGYIESYSTSSTTSVSITLTNITRYVRFAIGNNDLTAKICFHIAGTRTGYSPHTQSYTLPFKYQGSGVGTAHDTLEITETEYVFTKNITEDNLSNYAFYYADSTKFLYTTRELNGCRTDSIWSPNALTNISGYKLVDSNKLSDNDVACTIYTGKFYIRNDVLTEQQLKDVIANKTIKYQLATPQVVRIPKRHLGIVRIKDLTWHYVSSQNRVYSVSLDKVIKQPENNTIIGNIYCSALMSATWDAQFGANDKIISITGQNEPQGAFGIKDISCLSINDYLDKYGDYYIFYETQDEVTDIISNINIEAGGSITTNWFSWIENQLAVLTRESATLRDITFTKNGDNDLSVSGTSQQDENFVIGTFNNISGHKYLARTIFLNGKPTDSSGYWIKWKTVNYGKDIGDGIIFTGTATESSYIIFTVDSGNIATDCRFRLQIIDLTIGFGEGNEPTSINDPRIQYIIKHGYIPTNTTGTAKSIAREALPNIDFKIKCR